MPMTPLADVAGLPGRVIIGMPWMVAVCSQRDSWFCVVSPV